MQWDEFVAACPEIGPAAEERFRRDQLVMLGTLRANGSPRISPTELDFAAGRLMIGMMWRSPKAVDLLRDGRAVIHSVTTDKSGADGDFKIYARAAPVADEDLMKAFRSAIRARLDWEPGEEFHLFAFDVDSAAFVDFRQGRQTTMAWDPSGGFRTSTKKA